jgi:group I intron endonuclease
MKKGELSIVVGQKRKKTPKLKAVYAIMNLKNGMVYVGGTTNLFSRISGHKSSLRRGKHTNSYLQKDFDEFGEGNFAVALLERVLGGREELIEAEQRWMDMYSSKYNISPRADGSIIAKETREKISKSQKRNFKQGTLKKPKRATPRKKLTPQTVFEIREARKEGLSYKKIGDRFGINHAHVGAIIRRKIWKEDFNPVGDVLSSVPAQKATLANKSERDQINALLGKVK